MRAVHRLLPMLSICCTGAALAQTIDAAEHKYLYVEACRPNVQSVFRDDLLDKFGNVLAAKTRPLAIKPGEARADTIEIFGLIISADETKSPSYAGTTRIIDDLARQYAVASCGIVGFQYAGNEAAPPPPPPAALGLRLAPERRTPAAKLTISRSERNR